jgi:Na+-transporting methylmalonyl-CoA/oxaloacetate decarboxylase gamma subunit
MSLGMTIVMLIAAWLAVAGAMLWGVMRISRRHHPQYRNGEAAKKAQISQHQRRHTTAR